MENNFDMFNTPNNFTYSAIEMENLQTSEYTLVNMLVDESGSVYDFQKQLEDCMVTVVDSCKKHPRSQNLLLRTASFASMYGRDNIREIHGFSPIDTIDLNTYKLNVNGSTPLFDATLNAIETLQSYAEKLNDQDYFCNGILFVITDGEENKSSVATLAKIKNAVATIRKNESLESIKMILIGVNDSDQHLKVVLDKFKNDAGFEEYISLGDVSPSKLAKLAKWISQSISFTSQALGTGGPSQNVNFTL